MSVLLNINVYSSHRFDRSTLTLKKQIYVKNLNKCSPFSIKIPVKYNTVLLVVKWPKFFDLANIFCAKKMVFQNQHRFKLRKEARILFSLT